MTEQEAKVILRSEIKFHSELSVFGEALSIAIKTIEEIRQYRALGTVEELRKTMEKQRASKWIPCSERLPEEPEEIPTEDEPVEEMVLDGKFKEYIVMIYGADAATTLYYIGSNNWYDGESGECYYRVEAWQPLPEPYIADNRQQS